MKTIGVLALQGAFIEHVNIYKRLGVPVIEVRNKKDLDQVQGLIMPGGESTSNKLLLKKTGLDLEIIKRAKKDLAIWGVCAGIILLADLGLLDVEVERNAYGRQLDSFESPLSSEKFPKLEGVFIRAPKITKVGKGVEILARHQKDPVLVQGRNILGSTFHPELTDDTRTHEYFYLLVNNLR